jgi:peptide/nickel transport system permease protein
MKLRLITYILKKLVVGVLTLFALSILVFYTTTFFSPWQRVALFMPDQPYSHSGAPDPVPGLIEKYGLDDPFYIQYFRWLNEIILKGNLGYSYRFHKPITSVLSSSFAATFELVMYSAPIAIIGGYKLGLFLAKRASSKAPREDPVDFAARSATIIGYSIPSFCLGLILLEIAWLGFKQFPTGRLSVHANDYVYTHQFIRYTGLYTVDSLLNGQYWIFFDAAEHLILPVITLATEKLAIIVRITRSSMIRESFKPYTVTAKAKGLDEKSVIRHAKKNSLISVLTVSGILLAGMLTGVIVTESLFVFNGIGFVIVAAATNLDYTLLVSIALSFCVIFMVINLIVDIVYVYIDPRVKA